MNLMAITFLAWSHTGAKWFWETRLLRDFLKDDVERYCKGLRFWRWGYFQGGCAYLGLFTDPSDQGMFIVERGAFKHLCERLVEPCSCHFSSAPWKLDKSMQVLPHTVIYIYMLLVIALSSLVNIWKGYVLWATFQCRRCHKSQVWASSRHFGGRSC